MSTRNRRYGLCRPNVGPVEKDRVQAFSDGVIAILITIMVLELKTPHTARSCRSCGSYPIAASSRTSTSRNSSRPEVIVQLARDVLDRSGRGVELQVVGRETVHGTDLAANEPDGAIAPRRFSLRSNLDVAVNGDPYRGESVERLAPVVPLVRLEGDVVDEHIDAGPRDLANRPSVRVQEAPRLFTNMKGCAVVLGYETEAVARERPCPRADLDPTIRELPDEVVDAEDDPAITRGRSISLEALRR